MGERHRLLAAALALAAGRRAEPGAVLVRAEPAELHMPVQAAVVLPVDDSDWRQRAWHDWLNPAAPRAAMDGSLAADFFSASISR